MTLTPDPTDAERTERLLRHLREILTRPWVIMEVGGGHAHFRGGLARVLPKEIELLHGLGCPLCVTPLEALERARAIALLPDVIATCCADLLRALSAHGGSRRWGPADVRVVDSPLDAVEIARTNPGRRVVFLGIGLEASAPADALALVHARRLGLGNFSMLVSHALVPPSIAALLQTPGNRVQAFLGAGSACAVTGTRQLGSIARRFGTPVVLTGPEPVDLLEGVVRAVRQLEAGRAAVESHYGRPVTPDGDPVVKRLLSEVFVTADRTWRGVGTLPGSAWRIAPAWRDLDAEQVFPVEPPAPSDLPHAREAA